MRSQGVLIGHRDPITGLRDIWGLDCSLSLQDNIELRYPDGLDHEMVTLSINGEVCDPINCVEMNRKATPFDRIDLIFRQRGGGFSGVVKVLTFGLGSYLFSKLTPKPEVPNDAGSRKDSPNNSLSGQTNIARTYQAIPDIYGLVRSYPDLIQQSLQQYISNVKYVDEWFCVGVGEHLIENRKYSDTPLANISGSSSTVYHPNQVIPEIIEPFNIDGVNGQELKGFGAPGGGGGDWLGPFFSNTEVDGVWFNIVFQRGLNGLASIEVNIYQVDQNNNKVAGTDVFQVYTYGDGSFPGSFESKYFTEKITGTRAKYAFRIRRNNGQSTNSGQPDQAKVESSTFIRKNQSVSFGDVTIFTVRTIATEQATGLTERLFNIEATRKTITWDGSQVVNALAPSRSFADAILHSFVEVAGRDVSELDVDSLYAISDSLTDSRLGYFDFTFDDKDISLGQRIQTICNAARVAVYRDGQLWRFVRDEVKPFPTMQLDRRTLKAGSDYRVQIQGHLPSSFDGVKLEYVDPVTNKKAFINLKIDTVTSQITEATTANPYEIQLAGCRDPFQAMNRAQMEARKIIYQRTNVRDTVLGDPYNQATFGSMIKWVDSYDVAVNDGEILGVETISGGFRFLTSEPVTFEDGKTYRVTVTDDTGQVSSPAVATARPDNKFGFDANVTGWYVADDGIKQLGSRYLVTTEEEQEAAKFIVSGRTPTNEGDVQIELIEYDDRIYEYDDMTPPGFILLESGDYLLKEDFNRIEV